MTHRACFVEQVTQKGTAGDRSKVTKVTIVQIFKVKILYLESPDRVAARARAKAHLFGHCRNPLVHLVGDDDGRQPRSSGGGGPVLLAAAGERCGLPGQRGARARVVKVALTAVGLLSARLAKERVQLATVRT